MRTKLLSLAAVLLVSLVLLLPVTAEAVSLFRDVCNEDSATGSAACSGTGTAGSNPVIDTLNKVTTLVAVVAGAAAVILMTIAGIMFATSGGDSSKIESAKKTIIYTVVGLFVIVLARVIIGFVIVNVYE